MKCSFTGKIDQSIRNMLASITSNSDAMAQFFEKDIDMQAERLDPACGILTLMHRLGAEKDRLQNALPFPKMRFENIEAVMFGEEAFF